MLRKTARLRLDELRLIPCITAKIEIRVRFILFTPEFDLDFGERTPQSQFPECRWQWLLTITAAAVSAMTTSRHFQPGRNEVKAPARSGVSIEC